jgi:acetyl-CoA synthetase
MTLIKESGSPSSPEDLVWEPSKSSVEATNVKQFMDKLGFKSYAELVKKSSEDISWWWKICEETLAIKWSTPYSSKIFDVSQGIERTRWFPGGELNAIETVLDQKTKSRGSSKAFIWEGEDGSKKRMTYSELQREVSQFSNYLKGLGIKRGDVVASCLPMLPETIVAMLGTIRIGAIFSPIFCGYGPAAIASRISNSNPRLLVTCDGYFRKGSKVKLKPNVDESLNLAKHDVPTLIVERLGEEINLIENRDSLYRDNISKESSDSRAEIMKPDDPALLLYTSGTTGKPKGAVISHCGVLLHPGKEIYFNLDTKANDMFMWITDIGWMMGPWQIFGVQEAGATHVIFEGVPDFPQNDRIYRMIEEYKITHLGHAATTVRMIRKYGDEIIKEHNLSSLRILGNTGETIDPDTWIWEMKSIGGWNCPMINLSGGTEIFGCFLSPSPIVKLKPSTLWGPGLGMDIDVFDDDGRSLRGQVGYLVCKKPAPGMTRGFWNDYERYIETYWSRFSGVWYHGDWAYIDDEGYWFLRGRADDVIKVAGRRVGPAEIESILNSHPAIAESACIGLFDEVKGEKLYCFAIPKKGAENNSETLKDAKKLVVQNLGKTLEPDEILFVEDLPRTRSGKIIRRLIRAVVSGDEQTGDTSTMENPESLEKIKKSWSRQ